MRLLIFIFTLSFSISAYALKDCSSLPFWKEWNNCEDTLTFPDGTKYVGEFKDDMYNGQGTYTHPDGTKYVGEFKDHKWHGQGTLTVSDEETYNGYFINGDYVPFICSNMGLLEGTEAFGDCVLKLIDKIN